MKRAALLARVSTPGQEVEETIESQLAEIKQRITDDGNQLLEECQYIDDGWPGDILIRPGLDHMRDGAAEGLFDILYVYDRGRIARKYLYQELVLEELRDERV